MPIADVTNTPIADLVSLKGRRALVTGGAQGLGRAIADRLAEAGAAVLIGDLNADGARQAAAEIARRTGATTRGHRLDVTDSASVAEFADLAVDELGGLDIWVNNAGIFPLTPIIEMTDEIWDNLLDINLRGTFIGAREAARRMVARETGGVIINMSSTAGLTGAGPGIPHYVASKHGVIGLTKQMAHELAPHRIRVLSVAPTAIRTEGVEAIMAEAAENDFDLERTYNSLLGRTGVPDDIARIVLFCASDLSIFMTGSVLLGDGGNMTF